MLLGRVSAPLVRYIKSSGESELLAVYAHERGEAFGGDRKGNASNEHGAHTPCKPRAVRPALEGQEANLPIDTSALPRIHNTCGILGNDFLKQPTALVAASLLEFKAHRREPKQERRVVSDERVVVSFDAHYPVHIQPRGKCLG